MKSVSQKNYYDKDGRLLLAKGVPMTLESIRKLQQYKLADTEQVNLSRELDKKKYAEQVDKFKERCTGFNIQAMNSASDMLINIIFESKQNSWWMYVNALSNHIDWIYTHSIDVAIVSMIIGLELKYSEDKLKELGLGALLHDIGKLLIPRRILQNTQELTDVEQLILSQHCELGRDSMLDSSLSEASLNVILHHHERMDGSGYPYGLKADQMGEYTKIVIIANEFDALTAGRCNRKVLEAKEALGVIKMQNEKYPEEYLKILENILA